MNKEINKLLNRLKDLKFDLSREIEKQSRVYDETDNGRILVVLEDLERAKSKLHEAEDFIANINNL